MVQMGNDGVWSKSHGKDKKIQKHFEDAADGDPGLDIEEKEESSRPAGFG